jgi:hypothetical protein
VLLVVPLIVNSSGNSFKKPSHTVQRRKGAERWVLSGQRRLASLNVAVADTKPTEIL